SFDLPYLRSLRAGLGEGVGHLSHAEPVERLECDFPDAVLHRMTFAAQADSVPVVRLLAHAGARPDANVGDLDCRRGLTGTASVTANEIHVSLAPPPGGSLGFLWDT